MAMDAVIATVNGALGHGFSSGMVPMGLTRVSGRSLNPARVVAA
jgi:hypothetical protein